MSLEVSRHVTLLMIPEKTHKSVVVDVAAPLTLVDLDVEGPVVILVDPVPVAETCLSEQECIILDLVWEENGQGCLELSTCNDLIIHLDIAVLNVDASGDVIEEVELDSCVWLGNALSVEGLVDDSHSVDKV